jgi:hypothetical protein
MSPVNPPYDTWEVGVPRWKINTLGDKNHESKLARMLLLEQVVGEPDLIIKGWDRLGKDGCYVYVGRPSRDYTRPRVNAPAPPGQVFLVFVLPDGTIDDWAWRPVDEQGNPEGVGGETVWQA